MNRVCLLVIGLLVLSGIAVAEEEEISSAQLAQLAVSRMGETSQEAQITSFDNADSSQIGYSSNSNVTQTIYYDNIGNGSILQWGESGDMTRMERSLNLSSVNGSGFTWQWINGDVNQTINVRNSENIYLKQIVGGLRKILFPDEENTKEEPGTWTFCGKAENGRGGLPLCAEKFGKKIYSGKYTVRDTYMLEYLEDYYDVFPSENNTPHVILTKWNITQADGNLKIKYKAHNFARQKYNATLMLDLTPKINISIMGDKLEKVNANGDVTVFRAAGEELDGVVKVPDKKVIEVGNFTVSGMTGIESEAVVPLNGTSISTLQIKVMSE